MDIDVAVGAGAYVCGEETALMNSIEGSRGDARYKPPFPPQKGLWARPTIINNVETLMNVPAIIENGADWFCQIGTAESKGTKVFSVSGDVAAPGVYELELGSLLSELVVDIAGAANTRMVQVGGAAGRIIPAWGMDVPLAFETHPRLGCRYRVRRAPKCDRCGSSDMRILRRGVLRQVHAVPGRHGDDGRDPGEACRRSGGRRRYRGARRPLECHGPRIALRTRAGSPARGARHSAAFQARV